MEDGFLKIGTSVLDVIDVEKPFELQLALTMLFQVYPHYVFYGDTVLMTTPSILVRYFGNYEDLKRVTGDNVIDALLDMRDRGLVKFKADKVTLKTELTIDVKPLLNLNEMDQQFVKIKNTDFIKIMTNKEPFTIGEKRVFPQGMHSIILWMYCSVNCFNWDNINYLSNFDAGEVARDIADDKKLQELTYVFCNASLETLRFRKHATLELETCICCDDYAHASLKRLVELGVLKVQKHRIIQLDGTFKTMNLYYLPILNDENMKIIIKQYCRRYNFAIKGEMELPEPPARPKPKKLRRRALD